MPLDPYLTPGVTSESSNEEILQAYYEANSDLSAQIIVPENERAKKYVVTFFDGDFQDGITMTTFSNFFPYVESKFAGIEIPHYKFGSKPQFMLESLPREDKEILYNEIKKWKDESAPVDKFDTIIDVLTPDGKIIQTWEYSDCSIIGYELFLDENLLYTKYHDKWQPEMVDKTKFSCNGLDFQAGI